MSAPFRLRWWLALPLAAVSGWFLDLASPELGWWPLAWVGAAGIFAAVWQQRLGVAALVGLAAGASFWLPHISWLTLYLGPVPWLGLSGFMTFWWVLCCLGIAVATTGLTRVPRLRAGWIRWIAQAAVAAGIWVLREQVQGIWPYGGFAWGRLVHTQADSPLLQSVSWFGFAGLSGVIAVACALPVAVLFGRRGTLKSRTVREAPEPTPHTAPPTSSLRRGRPVLIALATSAAIFVLLSLLPAAPLPSSGELRVAAVQGNSQSGIFDDRDSGDVLADHLAETEALLDRLEAADEQVDLIVWPENSAEFGLPDNVLGAQRIAWLAERAHAPIVVGSVLHNAESDTYTNSTLVWGPAGQLPGRYDKRYPVPFGEYMPNRDFFHALAPDLVDLVQLEYTPGTLTPVVDLADSIATAGGSSPAEQVRAGLAICFDIIFDQQAVAMVADGAEFILAQTNNADFGRTDESVQQLAITRLRAVETGRAIVNISTVGVSATIAPDGHDLTELQAHTAGAMVAEVPLVTGETPALRFGAWIAGFWVVVGLGGIVLGGVTSVAARRRCTRDGAA